MGKLNIKLGFDLKPGYFFSLEKIHSMDFDDTWHPTTHPSGAVLPALLAISESLPEKQKVSGLDLLLAFNIGIEVQGRLMHFSKEASNVPKRYVFKKQKHTTIFVVR